ncbi:MAG: HEPN domain-containing protein [bacterium]
MNGQVVAEWVKKAEDNYRSALMLAGRRKNPVPDVISNQCQQCVEKYIKALLVFHKVYFRKIHDLVQLEELNFGHVGSKISYRPGPAHVPGHNRPGVASSLFAKGRCP